MAEPATPNHRPEEPAATAPGGKPKARCVMWSAGDPPRGLLKAIRRRGVEPIVTHDAYRTMAELVRGGSMRTTGPAAILLLVEPAGVRGKRAMLTACRKYAPRLRVWVFQALAPTKLRPINLAKLLPDGSKAQDTHAGDRRPSRAVRLSPPDSKPKPPTPGPSSPEDTLVLDHPATRGAGRTGPPLDAGGRSGTRAARLGETGLRLSGGGSGTGLHRAGAAADNDPERSAVSPTGLLSDEELAMLLADDDAEKR